MPKARAGEEEEDSRPKKLPKGAELLTVDGREVTVTNAQKVLFPEAGHTKLDLVQYYLASPKAHCVAPAAGLTCWCVIPMALARSSSTRSARRIRAPSGSRWWR